MRLSLGLQPRSAAEATAMSILLSGGETATKCIHISLHLPISKVYPGGLQKSCCKAVSSLEPFLNELLHSVSNARLLPIVVNNMPSG